MKYLNIGCGIRFHKDWINIDFRSYDPAVKAYNLLEGIPLPDDHVEVVYHSHLLEHFPKDRAQFLLSECMRVLKPGGVLRIAVPDLEGIVRAYLKSLEEARANKNGADEHYDWMAIELLDQLVREKSGGDMLTYLSSETVPAKEFIIDRLGTEAKRIMEMAKDRNISEPGNNSEGIVASPGKWREHLLRFLLGKEYALLQSGRFRHGGEVHYWMYDNYSLKKALTTARFTDIMQQTAVQSYIPDWQRYYLDVDPDGSIYKPDSLYMEGRKPDNTPSAKY